MTKRNIIDLQRDPMACRKCGLANVCLPIGLSSQQLADLGKIVKRSKAIHKGDHLFTSGSPFRNILAIKTGGIKTYRRLSDGNEQILGFYLPGELIGLEAIDSGVHLYSAAALETSSVCEIPFPELERLSRDIPELQHQIFRAFSKKLTFENQMQRMTGRKSAEERLATFLISLSNRLKKRGLSPRDFNLSMSREEIGNYLGLAMETISRVLTHFHEQQILTVKRRHIQINDLQRLTEMCVCEHPDMERQKASN